MTDATLPLAPRRNDNELGGITDLCLLADLKPGFVDALETDTYPGRLRKVLRTLNALRVTSREALPHATPYTDIVARWRIVHSFRWAVLEPEGPGEPHRLLLNVMFDGGWEPYMRVIWDQLGSTLDLILCHAQGYPLSCNCSFDTYAAWVRKHEVTADFLFIESGRTVCDAEYLRDLEAQQRTQPDPLAAVRLRSAASGEVKPLPKTAPERLRMALQALNGLAALYGLQRYFGAGAPDGECLLRATQDVFFELTELLQDVQLPPQIVASYHDMLDWFRSPVHLNPPPARELEFRPSDVQAGVLSLIWADRGALVLLRVTQPAAAVAWLSSQKFQAEGEKVDEGEVWRQVSLSLAGLRALGVPESRLARFPEAFREGMAARAGLLGDVRHNHPRQWTLPERRDGAGRVDLSAVHVAVVLRFLGSGSGSRDHARLEAALADLERDSGLAVLSVEPLRLNRSGKETFGFKDGISQPSPDAPAKPPKAWSDEVPRGEIFQGFPTLRDKGLPVPQLPDALLDLSSFLVVRKLRQHVERFHTRIESEAKRLGLKQELVYAKLMGRDRAGKPLVASHGDNDFNYAEDGEGKACPFHAHIRRSNPREQQDPQTLKSHMPRILRRGMGYGAPDAADQGLMFMAYNAHLAEQFEVIQRWVAGANASGGYSGQPDPILAVVDPQAEASSRIYPFEHEGQRYAVDLGPEPFVELQWGAYFYLPALSTLRNLPSLVELPLPAAASAPEHAPAWDDTEAWRLWLEDATTRDAAWAWVRAQPGGVFRTSYGVLVGDAAQVQTVLRNEGGRYSHAGYGRKMSDSIGLGFLGQDDPEHAKLAQGVNAAIEAVSEAEGFAYAHAATSKLLAGLKQGAQAAAQLGLPAEAPVDLEKLSENVLAQLCTDWFGLPDHRFIHGTLPAPAGAARCPHALFAVSRYVFGVHPTPRVCQYGRDEGQAYLQGVRDWLASPPAAIPKLGQAILDAVPGNDLDLKARTYAGIMLGFPPTTHANLLWCLAAWVMKPKLWELQQAWLDVPPAQRGFAAAVAHLRPALMLTLNLHPTPFQVFREVKTAHRLGPVELAPPDTVVVALGSATQQNPGLHHVPFGGDRADPEGPPPHACPGYAMAMGVMLGVIAALLEAGTLKPTGAPTSLFLNP